MDLIFLKLFAIGIGEEKGSLPPYFSFNKNPVIGNPVPKVILERMNKLSRLFEKRILCMFTGNQDTWNTKYTKQRLPFLLLKYFLIFCFSVF